MTERRKLPGDWVRTVVLLAVGLVAGLWIGNRSGPAISAQQLTPANVSQGAMTTQITGTPGQAQWLTLVNPATQSLAIYRFEPNNPRGVLKLEAVRQFRWDMMLSEYQNQPPEVSAVESMTRGKR
ncbi:MAG: hypothetical protein DWI24_08515 [Planctomycetota bacterium]|nr:MAG: hypothetical protein DWI24_08515 [Planctomycetota bacterium]